MTARQYARLSAPFRAPRRARALRIFNRGATWACYLAYPGALLALALLRDARLWRGIAVPAASFLLLSLVRRLINAKRPYEVLDIDPIIRKDTRGQSFPSRHVFSVFVIAMFFLWLSPWAGICLLALGALLAAARVIGGVHFPRDVLAGAACGVLSGIIGFYLIPAL